MRNKRVFAVEVVTDPCEALRRIVYGPGKLEAAAARLGLSHQTVSKQLNQDGDNGVWLSRAASLEEFFDSDGLAECFAARRGGVFVKLPPEHRAAPSLVQGYAKVVQEFAEASRVFSEALTDGKLSADEIRRFHKEMRDVHAAGERLVLEALAELEDET